jgi:hypothetical protein
MRLLLILLPIPLPTLLPIPTKACRKVGEIKTLEKSYGKEFTKLGVKPFLPLTPDASLGRFNHSTFNQHPWQGLFPAGGRALLRGKGRRKL